MPLQELLETEAGHIVEEAAGALSRAGLSHYRNDPADRIRQRLQALYDLAALSVRTRDLSGLIAHAERIAGERFHAGYDLGEVQTAFNALEEALWRRIVQVLPPDEQARALGLVSTVLGAGKDALARAYVSLASRAKAPSLDLRELFRGGDVD
jgi:hypothetical protein